MKDLNGIVDLSTEKIDLSAINPSLYSAVELDEFIKKAIPVRKEKNAELKEAKKKEKVAEKNKKSEIARKYIKNGEIITVKYKGKPLDGIVKKTTDKTVTILAEINGEEKKIWRYLYDVIVPEEFIAELEEKESE